MPNYCLCSIFCFFCLSTKRTQSISEKPSVWSTLKLLRKKVWFSFSFFLFHCLITLIYRIPSCCYLSDFDTLWRRKRNARLIQDLFFSCFFLFILVSFCSVFFSFSSENFEFSGIFLHRVRRFWKTWKTLKNQPILSKSGKSQAFFLYWRLCAYTFFHI